MAPLTLVLLDDDLKKWFMYRALHECSVAAKRSETRLVLRWAGEELTEAKKAIEDANCRTSLTVATKSSPNLPSPRSF